jgi:HAE1 family hydrophobic/amphiphilic exporter-1
MSIYKTAIQRPITTILIFVALMIFGIYSLINLPLDLYPEIELPYITVFTSYPGASASDIETNITRPVEDALNTISNLKEITSTSSDNISVVFLEFEYGTNLDDVLNDVRNYVGLIEQSLPEDAAKPTVLKINTSMMPIVFYTITAVESYPGLENLLDEKVVNPLSRIDGVGSVSLSGTPGRTIYVDVDPLRMEAYNLTVEQIGGVIASENLNMAAGYMEMGMTDYPLRVQGEFIDSDQIMDLVVGNYNGNTIYLKDVAEVVDTLTDSRLFSLVNGEQGVSLVVQKQSGANSVKIAREVEKQLAEIIPTLPSDVKVDKMMDTSEFITDSINNLSTTLMYAFIFVILVVLFFLGRWRATIIIVLTIPISLIVSFIYLYLTGGTINIISLSALSIAIGMVVDDAIVVLENITRHIERGSRPKEAAVYATNEVWLAVIVTTLTVVAVFLPLTLVSGFVGVLFKPLGMIVSITTVTSTIAAITLTPTLSSLMLRLREKIGTPKRWSYDRTIAPGLDKLDNGYERLLRWALHHKTVVTISATAIFFSSLLLFTVVDAEFMPESDQSSLSATIELQTGTRSDSTNLTAIKITDLINENYPEVERVTTTAGTANQAGIASMFSGSSSNHTISLSLRLYDMDQRERSVWDIAEALRTDLSEFPEIIKYSVSTSDMSAMGSSTVTVNIFGYDFESTNSIAEELAGKMKNIEGARDIEVSRDKSKPEFQILLDQEKMSQHGLNTATVSTYIRNRVTGLTASHFRESGDEYDIIVRFKRKYTSTLTDIENIGIMNTQGKLIRLGEIAEIKEYWSPPSIDRQGKERVVSVTITPYQRSLTDLNNDILAAIDEIEMPSDVYVEISGAVEDMQDSLIDLSMILVLSLVLVYLVMASQFESLKMPVIIMFAIPFSFTGVALALFITGTSLNVIAGIGAIMLVGIVVKNAIVLVDYINLMRERGIELYDAVAISGRSRLRPVLMTTLTTILGMLPLAMSSSEGSEIWSPMGISIIGGLTFSTIVTLIIVPVMYILFARKGERDKLKRVRKELKFLDEQ